MRKKILYSIFGILLIFLILSQEYKVGIMTSGRESPAGSMSPTINTGDLAIIRSPYGKIKPGMIVAYDAKDDYAENGVLTLHRVIRIEGERLITKGDSDVEDEWIVTTSDVKGIYLFKIPKLGYFLYFLREKIKTTL